jgi:hypothetical protein
VSVLRILFFFVRGGFDIPFSSDYAACLASFLREVPGWRPDTRETPGDRPVIYVRASYKCVKCLLNLLCNSINN